MTFLSDLAITNVFNLWKSLEANTRLTVYPLDLFLVDFLFSFEVLGLTRVLVSTTSSNLMGKFLTPDKFIICLRWLPGGRPVFLYTTQDS